MQPSRAPPHRFTSWPLGLALRLGAVAAAAAGLGLLLSETRFYATALVVAGGLALAFGELVRHATAADRELARVIDAIGQGELADRPAAGGRFREDTPLARAFAAAIERLSLKNAAAEADRVRLTAVVEHAPVALLTVEQDGRVLLLNRAARRLFDRVDLRRLPDLLALAPALGPALDGPGRRLLVRLDLSRGPQRFLMSIARSLSAGRNAALVSLQGIEGELEANEVRAWEELVRVLAHEIMNSLTPVASLAHTAQVLVGELGHAGPEAAELAEAVEAIHRRSAGLMRFVDGYRRFAEPPAPLKRPVPVASLLERVRRLAAAQAAAAGVTIETAVEPRGLMVEADPDLTEQALLNLVKNAIEAAEGSAEAAVRLTGAIDPRGGVAILVADTGPGLAPELAERIFVPFFTTKPKGSGIGLPIVRQIMLAQGGTVEAVPAETGAVFRVRL